MLSKELKALRVREGLTQKDLANLIDLGETSYTKRENGQYPFTVPEIQKMIHILNLSKNQVWDIFFRHDVELKSTLDKTG